MFEASPRAKRPKRLVGDTAHLRARFREAYPDTPVSTDRGSQYRAWLNAQRRQARGPATRSQRHRLGRGYHPRVLACRSSFIHELLAQARAGHLGRFLDDLAQHLDGASAGPAPSLDELATDANALTPVGHRFFRGWLRAHGMDPDTGKTTLPGATVLRAGIDDRHTPSP